MKARMINQIRTNLKGKGLEMASSAREVDSIMTFWVSQDCLSSVLGWFGGEGNSAGLLKFGIGLSILWGSSK